MGVAPHVVEQILNHQGHRGIGRLLSTIRSRYEREVRAALALWEDHIRTLVEGGERKIVPLATERPVELAIDAFGVRPPSISGRTARMKRAAIMPAFSSQTGVTAMNGRINLMR